jgi:hypothetical protein
MTSARFRFPAMTATYGKVKVCYVDSVADPDPISGAFLPSSYGMNLCRIWDYLFDY